MRRLIAFDCDGATLMGTLDTGDHMTGLLIVSGGAEIRAGAHRGMAMLAARIAEAGHPVFRYDRRGVGDSEGIDGGYASAAPDLLAAVRTFRASARVERIVAFGNCDAAAAIALFHGECGLDGIVLANPWIVEPSDDLPPPAAIRMRYAERLRDPAAWRRLVTGGVRLPMLVRGLRAAFRTAPPATLARSIATALSGITVPVDILLADRDNTAIAFVDAWRGRTFAGARPRATLHTIASASHSFAGPDDDEWLTERLLATLAR